MPKRDDGQRRDESLAGFGRYAGPATLILSSLADGPKHGYALTKDVEEFAGVRLAPGTLYEALARLESQGMIEALESADRRGPAPLTGGGAEERPRSARRAVDVARGGLVARLTQAGLAGCPLPGPGGDVTPQARYRQVSA